MTAEEAINKIQVAIAEITTPLDDDSYLKVMAAVRDECNANYESKKQELIDEPIAEQMESEEE